MRQVLAQFGITTVDQLGRCIFCMRAAFAVAVCTWLIGLVTLVVMPAAANPLFAAAVAFSVLWLAHLTAYAARAARCRVSLDVEGSAPKRSRRELFQFFAKAFAVVAVGTMLPVFASAVRAQGTCPTNIPVPCGTRYCCAGRALYYCSGYTGHVTNWRQMGTFCTNANANDDVADLRSNCAIFVQC